MDFKHCLDEQGEMKMKIISVLVFLGSAQAFAAQLVVCGSTEAEINSKIAQYPTVKVFLSLV